MAITEISWKGLPRNLAVTGAGIKADLRRGGARLLVKEDQLQGEVVAAELVSPDDRVIGQRRTAHGD